MLFTFPGLILPRDLEGELAPFFELLREELWQITDLRISLLGWRGTSRCQIRDEDDLISDIVFDPVREERNNHLVQVRKLRPGRRICDRPADLEWSPLASFFDHDD